LLGCWIFVCTIAAKSISYSQSPAVIRTRLDDEALFYLRARGISKNEARALLLYAFAHDAMQNIDIEPLKLKVSKLLAEKLEVDIEF
jgi:hypothetical protein